MRLVFALVALLALAACAKGTDSADCGGIVSSGTVNLTGSQINCTGTGINRGPGTGSGSNAPVDRHDVTTTTTTPGQP